MLCIQDLIPIFGYTHIMKIRLGTFNLFQFVEPPYSWYTKKEKFDQAQWDEKTIWIKHQIAQMDCDIIGFQEVFSRKALKRLVGELGFRYFKVVDAARVSKNDKLKYITTTVAIASKYPISNVEMVEAHLPSLKKHNFHNRFYFSRIPIKAAITLPDEKELLVYVAHLKSNRNNELEHIFNKNHNLEYKKRLVFKTLEDSHAVSLKQRLCEASSLFYDIEQCKDKSAVLLCDLNDKEFSITIDALSNSQYHDERSAGHLVLCDAWCHHKQEIYNPHPEAKEPKRKATSHFIGKGNVLDYIFISDDLTQKVTNYTVFDKHVEEDKDGSLLTSDMHKWFVS